MPEVLESDRGVQSYADISARKGSFLIIIEVIFACIINVCKGTSFEEVLFLYLFLIRLTCL